MWRRRGKTGSEDLLRKMSTKEEELHEGRKKKGPVKRRKQTKEENKDILKKNNKDNEKAERNTGRE